MLVGMDRDVILDRGSTPLTSTKKTSLLKRGLFVFRLRLEPSGLIREQETLRVNGALLVRASVVGGLMSYELHERSYP